MGSMARETLQLGTPEVREEEPERLDEILSAMLDAALVLSSQTHESVMQTLDTLMEKRITDPEARAALKEQFAGVIERTDVRGRARSIRFLQGRELAHGYPMLVGSPFDH